MKSFDRHMYLWTHMLDEAFNKEQLNEADKADEIKQIEQILKNVTKIEKDTIPIDIFRNIFKQRKTINLNIPDNVTCIDKSAFEYMRVLSSVTIGNGVTSIGDNAFTYCDKLTNVTIGNGVTSIGDGAFYECTALTNVIIPDSVISIGIGAFSGCGNLANIQIGNNVTNIGKNAFCCCRILTNMTIPFGVKCIEQYTFKDCQNLTSIIIPNSVTSIGHAAFSGCESLKSVTIPNSVTDINTYAFDHCYELANVKIGNNIKYIKDYAFSNCTALKNVIIGDKAVNDNNEISIDSDAFYDCESLMNVTINCLLNNVGIDTFSTSVKINTRNENLQILMNSGLSRNQIILFSNHVQNTPKHKDKADFYTYAPNGKKSNLTKQQWNMVRTPQFKAWFGDWENDPEHSSKMLDENGEPMVFYHGSATWNPFAKDEELLQYIEKQSTGRVDIVSEDEVPNEAKAVLDKYRAFADDTIFLFDRHDAVNAHEYRKWVSHGSRIERSSTKNKNGVVLQLFVNARNPLKLDFKGHRYNYFSLIGQSDDIKQMLEDLRYVVDTVRNANSAYKLSTDEIMMHANGISRVIKDIRDGKYSTISDNSPKLLKMLDKVKIDIFDKNINNEPGAYNDLLNIQKILDEEKKKIIDELQQKFNSIINKFKQYDCVICYNCVDTGKHRIQTQYVVLNPNNVKSATKNSGTFSTDNNAIMNESISIDIGSDGPLKESDLLKPYDIFKDSYAKLDSAYATHRSIDIAFEFADDASLQVWRNYMKCMLGFDPGPSGNRIENHYLPSDKEHRFPKSGRGFIGWMNQLRNGKIRKTGGESRWPILAFKYGDDYIFGHWIKLPLMNGVFIGCYLAAKNKFSMVSLMKELFKYSNVVLEVTEDIASMLDKIDLYTDGELHSEKYNGSTVNKRIFATSKMALNKALVFDKILHTVQK